MRLSFPINSWIFLIVQMKWGSASIYSFFSFNHNCEEWKILFTQVNGEWSFVVSTSLNSLNSSKLFAKNRVVIYHQKLFLIIYQLTTPLDPCSVLLKARNWKGFVTQSLESLTFSTQTAKFWITPLFEGLKSRIFFFFFFLTLGEGTIVRFR